MTMKVSNDKVRESYIKLVKGLRKANEKSKVLGDLDGVDLDWRLNWLLSSALDLPEALNSDIGYLPVLSEEGGVVEFTAKEFNEEALVNLARLYASLSVVLSKSFMTRTLAFRFGGETHYMKDTFESKKILKDLEEHILSLFKKKTKKGISFKLEVVSLPKKLVKDEHQSDEIVDFYIKLIAKLMPIYVEATKKFAVPLSVKEQAIRGYLLSLIGNLANEKKIGDLKKYYTGEKRPEDSLTFETVDGALNPNYKIYCPLSPVLTSITRACLYEFQKVIYKYQKMKETELVKVLSPLTFKADEANATMVIAKSDSLQSVLKIIEQVHTGLLLRVENEEIGLPVRMNLR